MKHQPKEKYKQEEELELEDLEMDASSLFKKICCPSCAKDVPALDLNINDKIAKCGHCNVVFSSFFF